MTYDVEERLQQIMDDAAEEIRRNGKESLYISGQKVCGGRIVVDISPACIATVTYEKTVIPESVKKRL